MQGHCMRWAYFHLKQDWSCYLILDFTSIRLLSMLWDWVEKLHFLIYNYERIIMHHAQGQRRYVINLTKNIIRGMLFLIHHYFYALNTWDFDRIACWFLRRIQWLRPGAKGINGAVTAHGRTSKDENTGFAFVNCTLGGTGRIWLGGAWRPYIFQSHFFMIHNHGWYHCTWGLEWLQWSHQRPVLWTINWSSICLFFALC